MKSKCSFILKASTALVLAMLVLFGSIATVVGAVASAEKGESDIAAVARKVADIADTGKKADLTETGGYTSIAGRLYFDNSKTSWNNVYLYVGHRNYAKSYTLTNTGYHNIWYLDISDTFTDRTKLYFANHNDSPNGQNYGIDTQYGWNTNNTTRTALTTANNSDANSLFTPSSSSAGTLTRTYPRVVAGTIASNGWDDCTDIMSASSTPSKTYENVAAGDYKLAVVGFYNNWSPAYRWAAKGTLTDNSIATWADAGDGDHNIKITTTAKSNVTITLNSSNKVDITVTPVATNYTGITAVAKGTTDGTNYSVSLGTIQSSTTVSSSTGLSVSAPTKTGYTFSKWVASGSGTFANANNASTTFYPAANSETATAQYKKKYTITKNTPTSGTGTITLDYTSRVAGQTYKVTLAPADGYKIDTFTVGGVDKKSSISNNVYSGTASGSADTIEVSVTYTPNTSMQLYIAGRFRVRPSAGSNTWTTTYTSGSDWNATSTNIAFTYMSGTTYKVDTYASLKELSAKPTNNQDPWFFVYDKTNSKAWHPTTQNRELGTTTEYNLTTNTDTFNVRFNSSSDDSPVTIYFDYNTKRLWYTIPDLYDVTVSSATGGSVTASPTRCEEGTTVELTISAETGYELTGLTTSPSVTISGTGSPRTFTMPADDVTVTPVFSKKSFSGLSAVGKSSASGGDTGSNYNTALSPNPATIGATSGTQVDGVSVSVPGTDPTGYVFAGWYTASGSFENAANKDTTFYPNAANAVAVAKYKPIYTITSSVDNTGTGAGTVTTSKATVEAGGSYTITATAKSGSAIESVTVNNTNKGTNASTTISSVSADQTVKVKFAAKPHVIGMVAAAGWTEPGDAMKSNADGTEFTYTRTELAAGTYDFQHYIGTGTGGTYDSSSTDIATKTISGGATLSSVDNGYGGKKFQLVLTAKSDVTLVSNGSKFTAITVRRSGGSKFNVTFKKADNTTITGTYLGTPFTTASADAVVQVYEGDEISFTVTADSGKYINALNTSAGSLTPAFTAGDSYTGKITNVTSARTVTPTAASKLSVAAKTNKSARGTVTVNKSAAAPGESINITVSPKNGTLKSLTATYGNGAVYTCNLSTKAWTRTTAAAPTGMAAPKLSLAEVGANVALVAVGADTTYTMTLAENSSVTINATFDTYSADSTWYYNGYDTSGNAVSGYHAKQMTESIVSGEKFSYYHVEGRTGTHQLMTVSNGAASSGTRYVYFTASAEGGWSTDENHQYAYFYNNSGNAGNAWPGYKMTKYTTNDYGQNVYRVAIPTSSSPTGVIFNNASNSPHQTTNVTDLSKGGYYLLSTSYWDDSLKKTIHDWQSYDCTYPSAGYSTGTEYFYQNSTYNGDYTGDFNTKGFYNHGAANKLFAKPKDLGTHTGDYYINVLYPNTTYTINGVTKTTGSNPMIIWSAEPLAGDDETVTIYAKDGAIRAETFGSTYANIADTKIYMNNAVVGTDHSGNITNQTYQTYKAAKGDTLVIKTQIGATDSSTLSNATDLKAKYYVRGFCVNGEVTELLDWKADGLYTLTFKVPEDTEITKFEITPIYYLKDTTANPIVTYRVTGFTDELKAVGAGKPGWGDTLYTYPYYGKLGSNNNAFGAYPGQPMVYYKGQYQMQIPQKSTAWDIYTGDAALGGKTGTAAATAVANTTVSGVTMSNGYWDSVHKLIMGYGDNSTSADHVQTYDYGDFYKIFNEKQPVDNIVFDFKYRTKKHNLVNDNTNSNIPVSTLTTNYGTNGNGFELLTNFHGRNVDLFGTPLSGDAADPSKTTPIYVVSIGGVNEVTVGTNGTAGVENIAGYYATEWRVYAPNDPTSLSSTYKKVTVGNKSSIPPEVLVLNNDDTTSFNATTYPSADASHNVTDWQAMYTALKDYAGHPVMISYEAADAQQGQGLYYTGTGGATRNDGRWLYSKNGENITSKIKIQYSNDNGVNYTDLNTTTPQVEGLSAYFTNDGVEGEMTYSTTIDPDKTFDFEAKTTNGNYKFVGWYMDDGTKITSDNASHTERSGSYTFIAKFMQVTTGQLILSHSADKGTINGTNYQGAGTAKIGVVVKNGEEVVRTYDLSTSDITLDDKIIKSDNSNYTIEVTLEATATGNDMLGTTVLANPSGQEAKFYKNPSSTDSDKTRTIVLGSFTVGDLFTNGTTQNVKNIIYHSYFNAATFHYNLLFEYTDRFGNTKQFYRDGDLTAAQAANKTYVDVKYDEDSQRNERRLMPAFIQTIAPHVSNFGETITWNIRSNGYAFNVQNHEYTLRETILAVKTTDSKRNVTFKLPYAHTDGIANGGNSGTAQESTNFALTGTNAVDFKTVPVLPNNGENGIYTEEAWKHWIAAPKTINDNGTTKYFQYWSIKRTDKDGANDPELARCYFQGFNFQILDNYTITPIYGNEPTDISNSGIFTGATYLETSRNQWNDNANRDKTQKDIAADLLFNDFVLSYNFKGVDIYKGESDSDAIQELGVVVERVKELDINQDGTKNTEISNYTSVAENRTTVEAVINGTTNSKFTKHEIAKSALDNKNRIMIYDAFYNGAGWNMEKQSSATKYAYKNWVYRAYTYIKYTDDQGNTQIKLTDAPAYFTMYDEAVKNYVVPSTPGN